MLLDEAAPNREEMHDRKHFCFPKISLLGGAEIGEQASDVRGAFREAVGRPGGDDSVEFARLKHGRERGGSGNCLKLELRWQADGRSLIATRDIQAAIAPADFMRFHTVLVRQIPRAQSAAVI